MRSSYLRPVTAPDGRQAAARRLAARPLLILLILSAALFASAESVRYGDAPSYANDIRSGALIEAGHLVWRPLGYAVSSSLGWARTNSETLWVLQFLCLGASVLSVLAIYRLVKPIYGEPAAFLAAMLHAVSNGFWAYSFSGCSYSLSMLLSILSLRLALDQEKNLAVSSRALWAGLCAGLSALAWAVQVLAAPAIWLALLLGPANGRKTMKTTVATTACLASGYLVAFFLPLLVAYFLHRELVGCGGPEEAAHAGMGAWLSCSRHGIAVKFGGVQIFRVAMGWAQSILSISDLNSRLRLWLFHETDFPWTPWIAVLGACYAVLASGIYLLVRGYDGLDRSRRRLLFAAAVAVAINLLFAAVWQGTDLERYFPSWPFQLLIFAQVVSLLSRRWTPFLVGVVGTVLLVLVGTINWIGTFVPLLGRDSYRQAWLSELHRVAGANDLVVVFRQSNSIIQAPHDPSLPKIDNVANEIVMRANTWRARETGKIRATLLRGGKVFLTDALFGIGNTPRDGWSFKEFPSPSPQELQEVFLPFKSDRLAFELKGEKLWVGKSPN
jgi:hypothetical protein